MDHVEEIKQKIDVVDLISSYLTLKKAGRNYKALCPFHKEKTPSFMVSPEKQIWYCFGCNQGGDIFTFIEKIEGLDFVGTLNLLAERAGVVLDRKEFIKKSKKDKFLEINELANKFFSYILHESKIGQRAKDYLINKRKLKEETIREFSLGYAPDSQTSLRDFLLKKGYQEEELLKIGLIAKNYQGRYIDKFRGRIIFPIENISGKIVAFAGRIFKENKNLSFIPPKYLNSPQSEIYDKSSVLYGLFHTKEFIREKDLAIIVEGYLDVISSYQAGVKNIVASSGTALTAQQVKILSRYTSNIAFAFDQDEAGKAALKRATEITRFDNINVQTVVIKEAKDPDELIQINPEEWKKCADSPLSIIEFYYKDVFDKYNKNSAEDKKKIGREIIPVIANIADLIERAHWVKKLSNDLDIDEKYIIDIIDKNQPLISKLEEEESQSHELKISHEMLLLTALILYPQKIKDFFEKVKEDDLLEEKAKNLYKILFKLYNKGEGKIFDLALIKKELEKEERDGLDLTLFLTEEYFQGIEEKDVLADIDRLIQTVLLRKKEKEKKSIEKEIHLADKVKDKEKIRKLLKKLQDLI